MTGRDETNIDPRLPNLLVHTTVLRSYLSRPLSISEIS
jgi:hypothetical protein